jgi:hypothetical protein
MEKTEVLENAEKKTEVLEARATRIKKAIGRATSRLPYAYEDKSELYHRLIANNERLGVVLFMYAAAGGSTHYGWPSLFALAKAGDPLSQKIAEVRPELSRLEISSITNGIILRRMGSEYEDYLTGKRHLVDRDNNPVYLTEATELQSA